MVSRRRSASAVRTRLEVVCLRRDRPELDDVAEHRRPPLQLVDEAGVLERAGERLRGAAQEGQVLGEVALAGVVDVEQPVELVVDDQRQADLAGEPVVAVGGALVLAQLRVVRARDGQDLVAVHGRHRGRVALEVEDAARARRRRDRCGRSSRRSGASRPASGRCRSWPRRRPTRTRSATERTSWSRSRVRLDERAQLHELVEDAVAPVHLLEERRVLERVRGDLAEPADEVEVLGEVARLGSRTAPRRRGRARATRAAWRAATGSPTSRASSGPPRSRIGSSSDAATVISPVSTARRLQG